jgi:phage terminase large subunit
MTEAKFPPKLKPLFEEHRYKIAYGGRGSGKSWSYAKALLILGASAPTRILCAREIQKSIKQSVHTLLSDQIKELGLGSFYTILETEIRGANGTNISFSGLASHTADTLKSFEGADLVWCEEAQTISKKSWDILIPTIRKPGSEIWVSFNPELDSDETYKRFVLSPPPGAVVMEVNHSDNPWFPAVLEQERIHCQLTNKEDYDTIWEGKCRTSVVGAIYAHEVDAALRGGRVCNVPYDPMLKVHTIWDLGWNDSMAIILCQKIRSELRVIGYIEDDHKTLDWYVAELKKLNYNWGNDYLPHDGKTKDFKTGKSAEEILKAFNRKVKITPQIGVENGIKAGRMAFPRTYFDKTSTARLVECLKRYKRAVNQQTGEPGDPVHDEYSHGADVWRYLAVVVDQLVNEELVEEYVIMKPVAPLNSSMGY